jgi:hypothetical protein
MGARPNRSDNLFGFRCCKDELDVLGRLFDDFQESIETLLRDHVCFVENENFISVTSGCEPRTLSQFARVIDAIVARCINLDDVERTRAVSGQLDTTVTLSTRRIGRAFGAIEATGENSGGRRLATTARSREQVSVIDTILTKSGAQRIGHLRLPDEFIE